MKDKSFEQSLPLSQKEKISSQFKTAIWKFCNDGNPTDLFLFVRNNENVLPMTLDINEQTERDLKRVMVSTMGKIERQLDYEYALKTWDLLKQTGALTEQKLASYIKEYIRDNMMLPKEEVERIKKINGGAISHYSPEFLEEFVNDLQSRIKNSLFWDIDIDSELGAPARA